MKPEIVSLTETAVTKYGMITVKTRVGELEYSYSTGDDGFTQFESGNINELTKDEQIAIDEMVDDEYMKL